MPTVVVLDVSASLLRPADLADRETTRQDVAQRGVLHFLQWLERWQKFEPICLVTMSSTCRILVPFETDHKTLRTALYDIALEDTASVTSGLSAACSLLQEQFGTDAAGCQVVLVVDGAPSFTEVEQLEKSIPLLPRAVVFHILAMGTESELVHCDIYKTLTSRSKGSFTHVRIPQDAGAYKSAFAGLAARFYQPWKGQLVCGHIQAPVMLYPDPNLGVELGGGVGQDGGPGGGVAEDSGTGGGVIAVRGFASSDKFVLPGTGQVLPQTPVVRRHLLLPDLRGAWGSADGEAAAGGGTGEENSLLLKLLLSSMRDEGMVAVCHAFNAAGPSPAAAGQHCCFLMPSTSPPAQGKKGLDHIAVVFPRLAGDTGTWPLHLLQSSPAELLPSLRICASRTPVSENLPSPETLQTDLGRVVKSLAGLPSKKDTLYKECEKLRRAGEIYGMPCMRAAAVELLQQAEKDVSAKNAKDKDLASFYIKDLQKQMTRGNSAEPVVRPKSPPSSTASTPKSNNASINNLLC